VHKVQRAPNEEAGDGKKEEKRKVPRIKDDERCF
jgi:hypothetical protein